MSQRQCPAGCSRSLSTMDAEVRTYLRYKRDIRLLLLTVGVWPGVCPIFKRILAHLGQVSAVILIVGVVNFIRLHSGSVLLIVKCIGLGITIISTLLKIGVFLRYHDDLVYLNECLSTEYRQDLLNSEDRPRLLSRVATFARFFYILAYSVGLSVLAADVAAIKLFFKGVYRHVYPMVFPVKYEPGSIIFWMFVGVELICSYYVWAITSGVDSVFGMYTMELCGELRVLASRFENLRTSKNYKLKLKECIRKHHVIIKSKDVLQKVFGFLSIWLAVTSAIVQCSLVFQIKMEMKGLTAARAIFLFFYIVLKLVQAFTYTWYGDLIAEESLLCMNAMYNAHWPGSGNSHFMNDVLIVLSQKPMIFKALGCMTLNLEIFSKILHTAVSYFFLIETLDYNSNVN